VTDTDLRGDLEAFMEAEFDLPDEGPYETPKDEKRVNGMLRALARSHRELANIAAIADDEIKRLRAWRDDRCSGVERRIAHLERALEGYTRGVLEGRTKDKRLSYPNGSLQLRGRPARAAVLDEDATKAWVAEADERAVVVETTTKLKLKELAAVATKGPELGEVADTDGVVWRRWTALWGDEAIPGVEIRQPKDDGFTASPA
jgi:hypothetical protein